MLMSVLLPQGSLGKPVQQAAGPGSLRPSRYRSHGQTPAGQTCAVLSEPAQGREACKTAARKVLMSREGEENKKSGGFLS